MKRFFLFLIIMLIGYVIYVDLSKGIIPIDKTQLEMSIPVEKKASIPYFETKVERGDTVISIIERHMEESMNVSIDQVIADFKHLNNGLSPEQIQVGKNYKFPFYLDDEE